MHLWFTLLPLDFQWYIEGCRGRPEYAQTATGFHDVNRFINLPPHPKSGYQSIPDFLQQKNSNLKSPLEVSRMLHEKSDSTILFVNSNSEITNDELKRTLHDIQCMAYLGKYYAHKIAGACYLAMFRYDGSPKNQQNSIDELQKGLSFWIKYVQAAKSIYVNPIWTNRVGYVDWEKTTESVKEDIEIASKNLIPQRAR